jgi:hypothetical protein
MDKNARIDITMIENIIKKYRNQNMTDSFKLEMRFIDEMPELYEKYPSIVKRFCRSDNLDNSFLYKMLDELDKVNNGEQTMQSTELRLGEELAQKYVYPVIDKKDKKI